MRIFSKPGVDCYTVPNTYKAPSDGFSSQIVRAIMAFVMGVVTMVRVSRAVPRKLTDPSLYSSDIYHADSMFRGHQIDPTTLPAPECFAIIKHMAKLEDKVNMLSSEQAAMSAEKEQMLNAALNRVSTLEGELAATKKVGLILNLVSFSFPIVTELSLAYRWHKSMGGQTHSCFFTNLNRCHICGGILFT